MAHRTTTLPRGTVLYHGTCADFDPDRIDSPCWFSRSIDVARHFARRWEGETPRILSYVTSEDVELPLLEGTAEFDDFCEDHDIRPYSAEDMADGIRQAGLAGWVIPDNYPQGDDILLSRVDMLSFQNEVQ